MSDWLTSVTTGDSGPEREIVDRFTVRLLGMAKRHLPARLRRRVDPDDIVQSVYRSFFRRLKTSQLDLDASNDLWRLLSAITYFKVCNAVKFHQRERRDIRRETRLVEACLAAAEEQAAERKDVDVLYDLLERLMQGLPESARSIVILRFEGQSIEEIAAAMNRSRRTVLRVLANVQKRAADMLESA